MRPKHDTTAPGGSSVGSNERAMVRSPTELRNTGTHDIDRLSTLDMLREINAEDATVPGAVQTVLPEIARAVDTAVETWHAHGTIHYFGAGTSGRIASLDAVELAPTFGIPSDRVRAHHAGGDAALGNALEGAEDDPELGRADAAEVAAGDTVLGLTASGRTPYVAGALRRAGEAGARLVLVSANPRAELAPEVDVHIGVDTGAEAIAGSTRMKAGTAQKLVLNAFSTGVMVRVGRTYSNLMVGVNATNAKLRGRMVTILVEATGMSEEECADALDRSGGDTRVALVVLLSGVDADTARSATEAADGRVREALRRTGANAGS
ncbi:N-acetylmuramic acid 6-phosphate etherase [Haloactinospora alba]|uniref:N-acetylmuramic acid 6-phosphate etherase n=2 Tax=Haloactinospora alba TaxID=405555 RepID=A0A543NL08_9ACTN|nr:N-acetylmuramic acid 6-phosphate etherase [Haloactinospora alba]